MFKHLVQPLCKIKKVLVKQVSHDELLPMAGKSVKIRPG